MEGDNSFNFPDLSQRQLDLIGKIPTLSVFRKYEEIVCQAAHNFAGYVRIIG